MFGNDTGDEERAVAAEAAREVEVLEAVRLGQSHPAELVRLGLEAETPGELHVAIQEHFGVTEMQSEVMAELEIRNLCRTQREVTTQRIAELAQVERESVAQAEAVEAAEQTQA